MSQLSFIYINLTVCSHIELPVTLLPSSLSAPLTVGQPHARRDDRQHTYDTTFCLVSIWPRALSMGPSPFVLVGRDGDQKNEGGQFGAAPAEFGFRGTDYGRSPRDLGVSLWSRGGLTRLLLSCNWG